MEITCMQCGGPGKVPCSQCNGGGEVGGFLGFGKKECPKCAGKQQLICVACNGKGSFDPEIERESIEAKRKSELEAEQKTVEKAKRKAEEEAEERRIREEVRMRQVSGRSYSETYSLHKFLDLLMRDDRAILSLKTRELKKVRDNLTNGLRERLGAKLNYNATIWVVRLACRGCGKEFSDDAKDILLGEGDYSGSNIKALGDFLTLARTMGSQVSGGNYLNFASTGQCPVCRHEEAYWICETNHWF